MTARDFKYAEGFSGFVDNYDVNRPQPPAAMLDMLIQYIDVKSLRLVVDIGCGTGLSTRVWNDRSHEVIGVEPNDDMRRKAEEQTAAMAGMENVHYKPGSSDDTGLPDGCADIVTCAQCLHWMEPKPTFAEVARILGPGGLFVAYDYDLLPTINHEADVAYRDLSLAGNTTVRRRVAQQILGILRYVVPDAAFASRRKWSKDSHLSRMRNSGSFDFVRELVMHSVESGNAETFVGYISSLKCGVFTSLNRQYSLSVSSILRRLQRGSSKGESGVDKLHTVAQHVLGEDPVPWYFTYRIRLGIKR